MSSAHLGVAKLSELHEVMDQITRDSNKFFEKGNKTAGVRARKALQDLKQLAQELRVAIQRCKSETLNLRNGQAPSFVPGSMPLAPPPVQPVGFPLDATSADLTAVAPPAIEQTATMPVGPYAPGDAYGLNMVQSMPMQPPPKQL